MAIYWRAGLTEDCMAPGYRPGLAPTAADMPAKAAIQFRAAASTLEEKPDSRLRGNDGGGYRDIEG
jgi:hypothetical protein